MLIKSVLSCRTSLYWEYKCNMEHKWTKRCIINNDWNFHSHGRAWIIYSVLERPHTLVQNHYKASQLQAIILGFLLFFPSPVYFNHCIYQHLSRSFYLGENRKVIMMWCLKIEVYFEYIVAGLLISICSKKSNCFLCFSEMHPFIWEPPQTIQPYWILQ